MAATIPVTSLLAQNNVISPKAVPQGTKRNLLCLMDTGEGHDKLVESIKSIKEFEFAVTSIKVNYQQPQEIIKSIQGKDADILFLCLPRFTFNFGNLGPALSDLDMPIILLAQNPELIMIEADLAAAIRVKGTSVMFTSSESRAIELLKLAAAPRILEGKRALIFGRPFESASVPSHNLNEDYIYKRTGVRIQYRPIDELKRQLENVSEASAMKEMERWKKEAVEVGANLDKAILDTCRLYVLLRSIIEKEALSAISIDCLGFSFNPNPMLPYPCIAFARLRDDGLTASCEADVIGLLSSMFLQEISQKSSYFANVSGVDTQQSVTILRHCVAPLKVMGRNAPALQYRLRDYHGLGRGVVPQVEFPAGIEVTIGSFNKDLKNFLLWPGRTQAGINDTDQPSYPGASMQVFCSNRAEVKIKDADRFLQSIANIHQVMVAGSYTKAIFDAALRMNINIVGPSDFTAPAI
jgi:L-fucose isomerase-like protein